MPRILIADDDADVVQFLTTALEGAGYELQSAYDAKEAADRLSRDSFDVVILDMGLQGLTTDAPAKALAAQTGSKARFLILTGRDLRREKVRGTLDGADASLEKGCSVDTLLATVQRLVKRAPPPR